MLSSPHGRVGASGLHHFDRSEDLIASYPQAGGVETLGGYRIIRKLGSGGKADVFLGHSSGGPAEGSQLVAVKVYRAETSRSRIDHEIEALANIEIPHIVRLKDLASRSDGEPVLILQRLNPAGLDRLLADGHRMQAGEAVTVLAPIAIALGELHRSGFTHGDLTASKILFDSTGAPVMVGLGEACPVGGQQEHGVASPTPAMLEADPRVSEDLNRLAALARTVIFQVANVESPSSLDLLRWLDDAASGRESRAFTAELADRLFALANAIPIRLETNSIPESAPARISHQLWDIERPESKFSGRGLSIQRSVAPGTSESLGKPGSLQSEVDVASWLSLVPLSPSLARAVQKLVASLRAPVARLLESLRRVRKPVWLAAAVGTIAFLSAVFLAQSDSGQPVPENPVPTTSVSSPLLEDSTVKDAVNGTDPVAATEILLKLRQKCLSDRSVLCLDGVHQQNSAAWDTDQRRIRDLQQGAELEVDLLRGEYSLNLIDRMGDTALIAVEATAELPSDEMATIPAGKRAPASILIIKTEAGWRIRDLLLDPR